MNFDAAFKSLTAAQVNFIVVGDMLVSYKVRLR
jgi:hypothetical protein